MLVQHAIWKVAAKTEALTVSKLATEKELEDTQRVPETYNTSVLGGTNQLLIEYDKDGHCLSLLKHYRSLMPMAMEARKPVFHLKAADGAIGAHNTSVRDCERDFHDLAEAILEKIQAVTRV